MVEGRGRGRRGEVARKGREVDVRVVNHDNLPRTQKLLRDDERPESFGGPSSGIANMVRIALVQSSSSGGVPGKISQMIEHAGEPGPEGERESRTSADLGKRAGCSLQTSVHAAYDGYLLARRKRKGTLLALGSAQCSSKREQTFELALEPKLAWYALLAAGRESAA